MASAVTARSAYENRFLQEFSARTGGYRNSGAALPASLNPVLAAEDMNGFRTC